MPIIDVSNLSYTYPRGSSPAITSASFGIEPGEIFGFLGPSGAGKSTTQNILTGLLKDYQGSVFVFNRDLKDWGPDYYERVGVSPETPNHFLKLTALENLVYFGRLYRAQPTSPARLLERVGLDPDANTLVSQFSKGMKTRLTVARALLHNPELLFLDEPTSGLDPVNARSIKDLILEQKQSGKTIFLTTHNMSVAEELCDRVALIVDGKIRLVDSPRSLKMRYGKASVRVEFQNNHHLEHQEFQLDTLADNPAFLALLQSGTVQTIHTQEASLEDIFIRVTGRSLS